MTDVQKLQMLANTERRRRTKDENNYDHYVYRERKDDIPKSESLSLNTARKFLVNGLS